MRSTPRIAAGALLALLALPTFPTGAPAAAQEIPLQKDGHFPEIYFPTAGDGALKSVLSFRGKKTVLHIFASW